MDKETLKKRLVQTTRYWVAKAHEIYPKLHLVYPKIEFDLTGRTAGTAQGYGRIRYNIDMAMEQPKTFEERTVPHEVAHLVVCSKWHGFGVKSHGEEWVSVMEAFGVKDIQRCHEYKLPQAMKDKCFPYKCGCHGKIWWASKHCHKRHQETWSGKYRCRVCKEDYVLYRRRKFYQITKGE